MTDGPTATSRADLLFRLLDRYERSRMFAQSAPWPRDVILRLDHREFPEAFAPDGREALADLCQAARQLASAGAVRLSYHRGLPDERPRELRLGPAEVGPAYAAATSFQFEPLAGCLERLGAACARLLSGPVPGAEPSNAPMPVWMAAFLSTVRDRARAADLAPLHMSRERFKRDCGEVLDALAAAAALAVGVDGWERVVSERMFSDSKRLGAIRATVSEVLLAADPRWTGIETEDAPGVLEFYGVRRKPGFIHCAGAATLTVRGNRYQLEDFQPTAHLPEGWSLSWAAGVAQSSARWVTTIENEFPFLSYVLEAGGPRGLGDRGEHAVYTAGFPSRALLEALEVIARSAPSAGFRHWGDADGGGMRIWWFIRSRIDRPVHLLRTGREWLESEAGRGRELRSEERRGLEKLALEIRSSSAAADDDARAALELIDGLLALGRKVEQERW